MSAGWPAKYSGYFYRITSLSRSCSTRDHLHAYMYMYIMYLYAVHIVHVLRPHSSPCPFTHVHLTQRSLPPFLLSLLSLSPSLPPSFPPSLPPCRVQLVRDTAQLAKYADGSLRKLRTIQQSRRLSTVSFVARPRTCLCLYTYIMYTCTVYITCILE